MIPNRKFKVVVLTHGGCDVFLELLAERGLVDIAAVILETPTGKRRSKVEKLRRSIKYDGFFATSRKFYAIVSGKKTRAEKELEQIKNNQAEVIQLCEGLGVDTHSVPDFHELSSKELLKGLEADLGVVYGTNIIRKSVFSIPRLGSINMHQGLAPFYRGGPAIFWELYNNEREIGITVHTVESKVDTGEIILQERVPFSYDFAKYGLEFDRFLEDFRLSLMGPAAQLMVNAIEKIAKGSEKRTKQDTTQGIRYRLPTRNEKLELIRRLKRRMKNAQEELVG